MFPPTTQRPPHHPMMAQQSGYIGYYSGSHHPSQYQNSTDLNYNYQPSMGHLPEGYNSGSWPNHPMYMASHANHSSMYSQRPSGYDEWSLMSSAMHQGSSSETSSPGLLSTMTSNILQPPLTPSPCALSNGNQADMESSPYYRNFCTRTTPNYGDHDSIKTEDDPLDIPHPDISIEPKSPHPPDSPYTPNWLKKSNSQSGNTARKLPSLKSLTKIFTKFAMRDSESIQSDDTFAELETGSKGAYDDEECDENKNISWKVGKTRTKDKYRVVYNDHQRMELEKEFLYSRYITIRKKTELAQMLGLSERQVKIWFQNRRAKERKQTKKRSDVNGDEKEKMENGITFLPGSSFHAPLHHPHSGGPPMFHHQFHVHQYPQHHKHPLMMDVKPSPFTMDLKPMDLKPSLSMQDDEPPVDFEMKAQSLNNNMH